LQVAYVAARGEMNGILDAVYFGSVEEEDRYRALLAPLVAAGTLPSFTAFTNESARKRAARHRRAGKERAEAEAHAAKLQLRTDADLTALIQGRRKTGLDDLVARLEAKYSGGGSSSGSSTRSKRAPTEPTDAEFAAAAKRVQKNQ
jgi:DnaJ homolog subfamily C member 9